MTYQEIERLRELEELDSDGIKLTEQEYDELNQLIALENEEFYNSIENLNF